MKKLPLVSLSLLLACSEGSGTMRPTADGVRSLEAAPFAADRGGAPVADAAPAAADRSTGTVDGKPGTVDGKPGGFDLGKSPDTAKLAAKDAGPPPANDTCASALPLTFTAGVAVATGDTRSALDDVNVGTPGCVKSSSNPSLSFSTPGKDVFYVIQLTAGQKYSIRLDGASVSPQLLSGALYLLESCTNPKSSCKVGGLVESTVWPEVELSYTPATSGSYWIGVDALGGAGGVFTLTVK